MPEYDNSIADVLRRALADAQDLIRAEIALAKAEVNQEIRRVGMGIVALGAAAAAALIAVVFLLTAAAWAISGGLGWAVWAGFAIVGGAVALIAGVLAVIGRSRLTSHRAMPRTMETMKENVEWMRTRTS